MFPPEKNNFGFQSHPESFGNFNYKPMNQNLGQTFGQSTAHFRSNS